MQDAIPVGHMLQASGAQTVRAEYSQLRAMLFGSGRRLLSEDEQVGPINNFTNIIGLWQGAGRLPIKGRQP